MTKQVQRGLLAVGALVSVGAANAAGITVDTTPITEAGTAVATVGAAVFALYVGIKLYKWIRRAL